MTRIFRDIQLRKSTGTIWKLFTFFCKLKDRSFGSDSPIGNANREKKQFQLATEKSLMRIAEQIVTFFWATLLVIKRLKMVKAKLDEGGVLLAILYEILSSNLSDFKAKRVILEREFRIQLKPGNFQIGRQLNFHQARSNGDSKCAARPA